MERIRKVMIQTITNNSIFIVFVVLLTYKAVLLNGMLGIKTNINLLFTLFSIPMLLMIPTIGRKKKSTFLYANILYGILTLIIYSNFVYYNYSTSFLSLYQIENLQYSDEIGMSLQYLVKLGELLIFFGDNILIAILSVYVYRKRQTTSLLEVPKKYTKYIFIVLIFLYAMGTYIKIDPMYKEYIYNKTMMMEHIGIYYYHIEDAKEYSMENLVKEKIDNVKLEEIYEKNISKKYKNTSFAGTQQGKNVIILQLESINEFVVNKKVNGTEITPNLNKFYKDNIYCTDMYNQGLGTTADSEHTVATSFYPLENGRVYQKYFKNTWDSLYTDLNKQGYYTSFMHPNVNTFWNRYLIYNNNYGINEYNDISQFDSKGEMAGEFFSDEQFFIQAVEKMSTYKLPFCTMMVAISTHIPYSLEGIENLDQKLTLDVSTMESEELKNYLLACNFVDYSFGEFLKQLEQQNLLENSIIVVYGDHGASIQDVEAIKKLYAENHQIYNEGIEKFENVHVPFGMKIPGISSMMVTNTVSKLDVKPTILDLLGIQDKISLGESIFSGKDYSFVKGIGYVTSEEYCINGRYIDRKTGKEIQENERLKKLSQQMEEELYFSDTVIKHNLLKQFLK